VVRQFSCPNCAQRIEWTEAFPYRPFCSERCRLIDLGDWLTEKHAIPGESAGPGDAASPEAMDPGTGGDEDRRDEF
jgi:hypothetical protein